MNCFTSSLGSYANWFFQFSRRHLVDESGVESQKIVSETILLRDYVTFHDEAEIVQY